MSSTRDRLIESTQELLWERGYVGTSPRAILARSGVGQGSMYHYFSGKAELARAAILRSGQQLRDRAAENLDGPGTVYERIERMLTREREVLRGCQIGGLTQDPDVVGSDFLREAVAETLDWMRAKVTEVLEEGIRVGELLPSVVAPDLAAAIVAITQGGYVVARGSAQPDLFDAAARGFLALLAPMSGGASARSGAGVAAGAGAVVAAGPGVGAGAGVAAGAVVAAGPGVGAGAGVGKRSSRASSLRPLPR